jgi:CubicO group peptidase (beta-lactamase class C family)
MHRLARFFISLAIFGLIATEAQVRRVDPAIVERVALEELAATKTPGAVVAVVSGTTVVFSHGYGVASVDTHEPVSPEMLFRLGSTTKMFTAAAVTGLAIEGKIDLDAPVSKYIPGLDETIGKLTANQLLSHTSGLRDEAPMFGSHDETALGNGIHARNADFLFAHPDRIYSYSNPAYWLAGYLAESVSGKPYADVIEQRLFQPLGMQRSTLRPTMAMTWPLAQGHEIKDGKPEVIRPAADNAATWPAGSIFSSAQDLARFTIAFMNDGKLDGKQVLSPKLIALMSTPHAHVPGSEYSYGYGLSLSTERGVKWVQHGGSRAGYGSMIRMAPSERFAVIIVANRTGASLPKLAKAIAEAMLPLEPEQHVLTVMHSISADESRRYAAVYVNGNSRFVLRASSGALIVGLEEAKTRFTQAGDGFLMEDAAGMKASLQRLELVPGKDGRIEFVFTGGRAFRRAE